MTLHALKICKRPKINEVNNISEFEAVDASRKLICQNKKLHIDLSLMVKLEYEFHQLDEVLEC